MSFLVNLLISLPARIASYFAWAGPLIARVIVGYVFMLSGWTKLNNLPVMIERFSEWGIPAPKILTPFVSGVECFGGAMLILGLFTRIPAAMLAAGLKPRAQRSPAKTNLATGLPHNAQALSK